MAQGGDFPLGVLHLLIVGGLHGKEFVRNHIFLALLVDNGIIVHQIEQEHGGAEKDSRYLQVKMDTLFLMWKIWMVINRITEGTRKEMAL